jgi:hypothetical protein
MEKKMKRFVVSVLCASVFFIGLGNLVENVGAKFKSDERALEILRQARQAVGGDQSIAAVRSMTITGRATKTFDFGETQKTEQGDWEVNLQLPDKFSRKMLIRKESGDGKTETTDKEVIVVRQNSELKEKIMLPPNENGGDKKKVEFTVKTDGGEKTIVDGGSGDKVQDKRVIVDKLRAGGEFHHNEMFRTTLALLLTPPQGVEVSYKYAGEANVDGANCDIVEALANGSTIRLYVNKDSHLPAMISYQAPKMFIIKLKKEEGKANTTEDVKVVRDILREKMPAPEMAEYQVKFSDYRSVGGVQLPFRWTQSVGGKDDETIEVASYELNPANIAEKFKEEPTRVFVRTSKQQ